MPEARVFDVVALRVPIVYNTYGDHDRNGMIYTLAEHEAELNEVRESFPEPFPDPLTEPERLPGPHPLVRPLVLRARVGERVVVRFRNELRHRAGIHAQGVDYQVRTADGGAVGHNPDSAAPPGGSRTYEWDAAHEGVFFFGDLADLRGSQDGSQAHGLFGALVVEPAGATWTDPVTGGPVPDGLYADVHVPGEPSFREYAVFMQDETPNDNRVAQPHPAYDCERPRPHTHGPAAGGERLQPNLFPDHTGNGDHEHGPDEQAASMMLMSYRTEPMGWRALAYERLLAEGKIDPVRDAIVGEEQHHSSWLFGDPVTPILRAYGGDRAKIRLVHAGVKETHIFHLHLHQWRAVPGREESPLIDSITISPQQALTIEPISGAGSVQKATGDVIFHCHLYPHFHSGMWGMWRVFDVLQDGTGRYPDGTLIAPLRPLPGHPSPPAPTAQRPGFPAFMAGSFPQKSPRPPRTPGLPEGMGREPTALEQAAFVPDPQPGEAFTKVTLDPHAPVRRYHLVVLQGTLHYFDSGDRGDHGHAGTWHDHRGVFYVLKEEIDEAGGIEAFQRQLEEGTRRIEPIAIRARKGEVLELTLTNALPPGCHAQTAFDPVLPFQPECGLHVHLVKFDPLVSDGSSVGWNYLTGTTTPDQGEQDHARYGSWIYRWYCDEEFGVVFFHDHLLANERQRHGLFGSMIAEPEGAVWVDPRDHDREVHNEDGTVKPGGAVTYRWYADVPGVVLLEDRADLRTHRHRGLVGALVVEPADATPYDPDTGGRRWTGEQALIRRRGGEEVHELVLVLQDGVRQYHHGDPTQPVTDLENEPEDSGQKAFNHRSAHLLPTAPSLVIGDPGTPLLRCRPGDLVRVHLAVAADRPRNHAFHIHGQTWPMEEHLDEPRVGAIGGLTSGSVRTLSFRAGPPGDYAYRTGVLRWALTEGLWGLIRVRPH